MNKEKQKQVIDMSETLEKIAQPIVDNLTKNLDAIISKTRQRQAESRLSDTDLQNAILAIPLELYYLNNQLEKIVLKESLAKELTRDKYNEELAKANGTVNVKGSIAEQNSQEERIVQLLYTTANKRLNAKISTATEVLNSCKKIITYRNTEMELNRGKL